jgi:uncharacterized protein YqgV (UPF0045/DUF77 family)
VLLYFYHFYANSGKHPATNAVWGGERRGDKIKPANHGLPCLRRQREKEKREMRASVAIQTLPDVDNDEELIRIVDEVIAYIKSTGLSYYVGPFETAIEGDSYDQLMDVVKECQHVAIRAGAPSVSAYIKVVYNPEQDILSIDKKVSKHHTA